MSEFANLFKNYKEEAFRLETLSLYKVKDECEDFELFLKTNKIRQNSSLIEYMSDAKKMIENGRRHIRARIIPNPITNYFIFETKVGYLPQSKIGFEFAFIEEKELLKNKMSLIDLGDFWLFDKSILVLMNYDNDGTFIEAKIIKDSDLISESIKIRNCCIENGKTLSYLLDKYFNNNSQNIK